jgi:phosphate:Na+ symporter
LFVYGMKITSEALQRVAGERLAKLLQHSASDNFLKGIFKGIFINGLVQSSTATSLMTISFVNAGLLSFEYSMKVLMGINIGSAVTAWIIALLGFEFTLSYFSVGLIGFFFPFLFSKNSSLKNISEFAIGLGILLLGAEFLKEILPYLNTNYHLAEWLTPITHSGYVSIIIFILVGSITTYVLGSSSAVLAITLVFLGQGWLSIEAAAAIALGENIGNALKTNQSAKSGNIYAKRSAGFHMFFNIGGAVWMFLFLPAFLNIVDKLTGFVALFFHLNDNNKIILALPVFHLLFNIVNIILNTGLIPVVERYLLDKYPATAQTDEAFHLRYINHSLLATPELALMEVKKELENFAKIIEQMCEALSKLLFEKNLNDELIISKLMKREKQTDSLELEVANYLTKLSESELSHEGSNKVRNMLNIANNLERVADIFYQMTKSYQILKTMNIEFPAESQHDLKEMLHLVTLSIKNMRASLEAANKLNHDRAFEIEEKIDVKHKELTEGNFERLKKGLYDPRAGIIFMDLVNRSERIGDHVINVNEALQHTIINEKKL